MQPLVFEIIPAITVMDAFARMENLPACLLLDSAMQLQSAANQPLGRYSFLMADPVEWIEVEVGTPNPLAPIRECLSEFQLESIDGLPPFQGGIAGLLSYDLNQSFEKIQPTKHNEFQLPALAVGVYDIVIAWDHQQQRSWIVSTGFPKQEEAQRMERATERLNHVRERLNQDSLGVFSNSNQLDNAKQTAATPIAIEPQDSFSVDGPHGLKSNYTADGYRAAVQQCIDYIYAGDVFQINLAQRLIFPASCSSAELYRRLRVCNPAPFAGYFDLSPCNASTNPKAAIQIISASPERLIAVRDRIVETRPIKGTRRRTGTPMVDIHNQNQLAASVKDRAENTMIVDLMRNDLSRCCQDDSIEVTQLCELERYQSVLHLVSAVQGELKPECDLVDLIEAIFPGGSITGAPKIRAMEIIAELEPHARGAYCGSLGYFGFNGQADFSILIRTITAAGGWWQIPVGGGIVSQSNPQNEYEETWTKAAAMLASFGVS